MSARWILFFPALIGAMLAQQRAVPTETPKLVWTWSKQCGGNHKIGVTVRLQRKTVYRDAFPICLGSRDAENGRAEFHFAGGQVFQGEYRTRPTDSIEG